MRRVVSSRNRLGDAREHVPKGWPGLGYDLRFRDLDPGDAEADEGKGHRYPMIAVGLHTGGVKDAGHDGELITNDRTRPPRAE